jgi:hypothetical protein
VQQRARDGAPLESCVTHESSAISRIAMRVIALAKLSISR